VTAVVVPARRLLEQGPVLRALAGAALSSLRAPRHGAVTAAPGPWIEARVAPPSPALVHDYLRHIGADPSSYRGVVPAHLFPQWAFPLASRALAGLPYPLARVLNAGCRLEARAPLPAGEPLLVRARLESVDDDGRRALVTTRVETGTKSAPDALFTELRAFVPLAKAERGGARKERAGVPADARELAFLRISADAGLDFAKLTGDVNPIHWIGAYARAAGFRGTILHGFATFSRALAALDRAVLAGAPSRLVAVDARFTKPLPLPARVGVYLAGDSLWVADAPGSRAYLEATITLR
jgi:acyl dehydratase